MSRFITSITSLIHPDLSIKTFYKKRKRILIVRDTGGLGDILMCRMMFEDFKKIMPDCHLVFACPNAYHDAVKDHPFVDEVVDSRAVDENDYIVSYNITTACGKHENIVAPLSDKNRSDIWANHCGIELTCHDMHLVIPQERTTECRKVLESYRTGHEPIVLLSPISAIQSKNLDMTQMNGVVEGVKALGYCVLGLHKTDVYGLEVPTIKPLNSPEYFGFINAADYIITVDTSAFHAAGGLGKPTVAVFSWADGMVYGKHYKTFELVQRHRLNTPGWTCGPCYRWSLCPKTNQTRKPCITEITSDEIVEAFKRLVKKYPLR